MTEFRAFYTNANRLEDQLFDVEVNKSTNPFGDFAILRINDNAGNKFDKYPRGTRVKIEEKDFSEPTNAYSQYFTGFVVERRESDRASGDILEVEAYSFDQFLRNHTVGSDQSGNDISTALENVIKDDTPVTWNASNVTVENDNALTRGYQGESVSTFLRGVSTKSANEQWGVNSSIEFVFERREVSPAPRDIDNTQWTDYDIPERGKRVINQVKCFYDNGNDNVVVNSGDDQLGVQNRLNVSEAVTFEEEISRPDINGRSDAIDAAKVRLRNKRPVLTGTVTTFGVPRAKPGDVINITIEPRGIDGEFRIAENLTKWRDDSNTLTIIEKRGFRDELLKDLVTDTKRVELANVDRSATPDVVFRGKCGVTLDISGEVGGAPISEAVITNEGLRLLARGWARFNSWGDRSDYQVEIGKDEDLNINRETTSLNNVLDSVQASIFEPKYNVMRIDSGGLDNTSGDARTFALSEVGSSFAFLLGKTKRRPASGTIDADFRVTIHNDPEIERGVVNKTGQTIVRDIMADNSPDHANAGVIGDGTTPVSESDTALDSFVSSSGSQDRGTSEINATEITTIFGQPSSTTTFTEAGQEDSNDDLATRIRFGGREVTTSQEALVIETVRFRNA